ncbi:MAG TPA: site-specific integrase [Pyrinomonadaceae bacterium]|jgi:integrase
MKEPWKEKQPDGTYIWRGDGRVAGRRYRPTADTKQDILDIFAALRVKARNEKYGLAGERKIVTLGELVAARKARYDLTLNGHRRQYGFLLRFKQLVGTKTPIEKLTTADFTRYLNVRRAESPGIKDKTLNWELVPLASMIHAAELYFPELKEWKPPRVPYISLPEGAGERTNLFADDEREKMIRKLREPRWTKETHQAAANRQTVADLLLAGLLTGFRLGELRPLLWTEVYFKENIIRTRGLKRGKVIEADMGTALRRLMLGRWEARRTEWVFAGARGAGCISGNVVYETLSRVAEKAKVTYGSKTGGFIFHDMRRTAITEMLDQGIPFPVIQSRTGQTRERVLQYAQALKTSKERASAVLEGRFAEREDKNRTSDSEQSGNP